jgi:hypothetical protein
MKFDQVLELDEGLIKSQDWMKFFIKSQGSPYQAVTGKIYRFHDH